MLRIPRALCDKMISFCLEEYPNEACGLLAGSDRCVSQAYPMTNLDKSPISYRMDPKEQLMLMRRMRELKQSMVAIYHSHTASAAYPSPVDVGLAVYQEVSYVLVSLARRDAPDVKSYLIRDGQIQKEELVIL